MRILVVEDYEPLRDAVTQALREDGYAVDACEDGAAGLAQMLERRHDVVLLDLMLPQINGLEVLRQARAAGSTAHVLVLTARDTVDDRVRGLDGGADDYLVKPFAMDELLARVRALVRREYQVKTPSIRIGHLEIDTSDHNVRVDGERIELTAREYSLLEYLVHRVDQVVTRSEIEEHLYEGKPASGSNVVDVYISYLRRKIERRGRPRLIRTRRGEGYVLSGRQE